jgi:Alpha-L-rhamnosidase N-terminal domain./Bacterial alpha-L-rhamnosidase.
MKCVTTIFCFRAVLFLLLYLPVNSVVIAQSTHLCKITNLLTEYTSTPIGIDVAKPRFSWQMQAEGNERGYFQKAYQIEVNNDNGNPVWNSGKQKSNISLNIEYRGTPLQAETRYQWHLTVWNQKNEELTADSWFETGLMDTTLQAWNGAKWIGGTGEQIPFYSHYFSVFKIGCTIQLDAVSGSSKASLVFGANDKRLMDKNKNVFNLSVKPNESYIRVELDCSNLVNKEGDFALIKVYRVGYHPEDKKDKPIGSVVVPTSIINAGNVYAAHTIWVESSVGTLNFEVDGQKIMIPKPANYNIYIPFGIQVNPMGIGGDYIGFPMVADVGFMLEKHQKAAFSNLQIRNYRSPSNILFAEDIPDNGEYEGIFAKVLKAGKINVEIKNHSIVFSGDKHGCFVVADPTRNSMPMLRSVFDNGNKTIRSARVYVTARGIYEFWINGNRVGNDWFNPGLSQYDKTHFYQTYDVTLQQGKNAIGIMLGEGWWSGNMSYLPVNWNYFGDRQSLLMKMVIRFNDGTSKTITSDPSKWKYFANGPVRYGSFFQGEVYDATKEQLIEKWTTSDYDDSAWSKAMEVSADGTTYKDSLTEKDHQATVEKMPVFRNPDRTELIGQIGENIKQVNELTAQKMSEVRHGVYVYDMGQNMVGVPCIHLEGYKKGHVITFRFAEMQYPHLKEYRKNKDMIMLENIRAALAQDIYRCKGGKETFQPHFTSHGYRFIEITGLNKPLPLSSVKGKVLSSVQKITSHYATSNSDVNRLWENICWSMQGNFLSIPTDCPQRNERMGWSGDISVFARTATYMGMVSQFLRRHVLALRDTQYGDGRFADVAPIGGGFGGIVWGSAGITVPWELYIQYEDSAMLAEHYDAMKRYVDYLNRNIDVKTGTTITGQLADWLSPEGNLIGPVGVNNLVWDAYYAYDLDLIHRIAKILGKEDDTRTYAMLLEKRKQHFNATYIEPETKKTRQLYPPKISDVQVSYIVPLALNLLNDSNRIPAVYHLVQNISHEAKDDKDIVRPPYSLMTGFVGTAWISKVLSDNGFDTIAYRLLQQTTYPSWLYPVKQGATTIWERLNSYTQENGFGGNNSMNSFNHYSFGAVGAWMYNYSLGIQRDESSPGFKHFILRPTPDPDGTMTHAEGYYDSMYGRIKSSWSQENGKTVYQLTVPANTSATLSLKESDVTRISESGTVVKYAKGIRFLKSDNGKSFFELDSGSYCFEVQGQ